ncbi:MAG: hypothetical protein H7096_09875 [Flavobacterium sp.]|nr:hypothetical protein [Pedobacter sp.]
MHFGKIVKNASYSKGFSAEEFALLLEISTTELLFLYEQNDWTSGNIKLAATALNYDFGKLFNPVVQFNFMSGCEEEATEEVNIRIKYPSGKAFLLNSWLQKMALIAKAIGLQMDK